MKQNAHFYPPAKPNAYLPMDIMDGQNDTFICTLHYPLSSLDALFPVRGKDILEFIYEKRPSLRDQLFIILIDKIPLRSFGCQRFLLQLSPNYVQK